MDEDKQKPKPIVATEPAWASGQNPSHGNETTGVEGNELTDVSQETVRPANWQEAVQDHFTPNGDSEQRQYNNMQDVIDYLEEQRAAIHMPSKEDLEKERRRRRTEGIISRIADGASAISNLITTTQYAPDMYNPSSSMSDATRARYERLKKEREADADRYLNYSMMIGRMKNEADDREYKRGRDALQDRIRISQDTRAQLKADRDAAMAELRLELMQGKITEQDAATELKQIQLKYADDLWNARVGNVKSQTSRNNRSGYGSGGGGGAVGQYTVSRINPRTGQKEYKGGFKSEQAARNYATTYAGDGWTYVTTPTRRTSTKPDKLGYPQTTTSTTDVSTKGANTRALAQKLGL